MKRIARVVLLATCLLGVSVGSAAPALGASFHSDSFSGNTILTGASTGNHAFDFSSSTLTCTGAVAEGTQTGNTSSHIMLAYSYSGCNVTVFGFKIAATVNMGGCGYTYSANGEFGIVNRPGAAKTCASDPITYRVSNFSGECHVKIGPQWGLIKVTYTGTSTTSETSGGTITMTHKLTALHHTTVGNLCTAGTASNGELTSGPMVLKGYVDAGGGEADQTPIWVTH
jgi:hypothetical protein